MKTFTNPDRISVKQWMADEGLDADSLTDVLEEMVSDSVCPALCQHGCEVEPDGRCEHDCPSILLALKLI